MSGEYLMQQPKEANYVPETTGQAIRSRLQEQIDKFTEKEEANYVPETTGQAIRSRLQEQIDKFTEKEMSDPDGVLNMTAKEKVEYISNYTQEEVEVASAVDPFQEENAGPGEPVYTQQERQEQGQDQTETMRVTCR